MWIKPSSLNKLAQVKAKILAFFDEDAPIRSITPADAADWRRFLKELGLSEATIKSHSGNAKTISSPSEAKAH